jgi:hypothetical protein
MFGCAGRLNFVAMFNRSRRHRNYITASPPGVTGISNSRSAEYGMLPAVHLQKRQQYVIYGGEFRTPLMQGSCDTCFTALGSALNTAALWQESIRQPCFLVHV